MYKMLVLDMDGTLLDEEQKIPKANKEAIKVALEKGIHIVLASGRHYNGMKPYIEELNLNRENCYSVTCSGGVIVDNSDDSVVFEHHINLDDVALLHDFCEAMDIDMAAYGKREMLVHHDNLFSRYDAVANRMPLVKVDFQQLPKDEKIYKINIINENDDVAKEIIDYFPTIQMEDVNVRHKQVFNRNLLKELWRFPKRIREAYNIFLPLPFCVELLEKSCNKAEGVKVIAHRLGIDLKEVIAMGDSGNDIHMIKEVGLGIAMANAGQELIESADEVTLSNVEGGVAHVIKKYLL